MFETQTTKSAYFDECYAEFWSVSRLHKRLFHSIYPSFDSSMTAAIKLRYQMISSLTFTEKYPPVVCRCESQFIA